MLIRSLINLLFLIILNDKINLVKGGKYFIIFLHKMIWEHFKSTQERIKCYINMYDTVPTFPLMAVTNLGSSC